MTWENLSVLIGMVIAIVGGVFGAVKLAGRTSRLQLTSQTQSVRIKKVVRMLRTLRAELSLAKEGRRECEEDRAIKQQEITKLLFDQNQLLLENRNLLMELKDLKNRCPEE